MFVQEEKPKQAKRTLNQIYGGIIERIGNHIFTFDNLPDNLNSFIMNRYLNYGIGILHKCTYGVNKGCYIVGVPSFIGKKRIDGLPEYMRITKKDYSSEQIEIDKALYFRNGYDMMNNIENWERYGVILSNVDESQNSLVKWSRLAPVVLANDSSIDAYRELMTNIIDNGTLKNVVSDNTEFITNHEHKAQDMVLNLTDVTALSKMQFLTEYKANVIKEICTLHGIPFRSNEKHTQSLTEELHDYDMISRFMNDTTLECLKKDIQRINDISGLNITVDYSDLMKQQIEIIEKSNEQAIEQTVESNNVSRETSEEDTNTDDTKGGEE